jgi:acyl-CoA synthetase (AMP-forming)/AMP-acid ligase II
MTEQITTGTTMGASRDTDIQFNLADAFEAVAKAVPDRVAIIFGEQKLTYAELDAEANKLAHFYADTGAGKGDHVALYLMNSMEHLISIVALIKLGAPAVNVNYRYTAPELHHIMHDSDAKVIVVELPEHQELLAGMLDKLPELKSLVILGELTDTLKSAAEAAGISLYDFADYSQFSDVQDFGERTGDEHFIMYTGGTTGYPKGVLWRHHDFFMKPLSGGNPYGDARRNLEELAKGASDFPSMVMLNAAPLMHGAASFSLFTMFFLGATWIMTRQFDAEELVRLIDSHKAQVLVIVGDGMGSPIADKMHELKDELDFSSLFSVSSGGAIFSNAVRDRMAEIKSDIYFRDNFGASESGNDGEFTIDEHGTLRMPSNVNTGVMGEDGNFLEPGSEEIGMIARIGNVPLAYYKDPEKTERTFVTLPDGRRASLLGDMGRIEADGSIVFLGRGSGCINTKGEKVFPEEVEAALRAHPDVTDALVVGVDDSSYGQRVAGVISLREGAPTPTLEEVQEHCRTMLAGYKLPRSIDVVDVVRRTPAGKANYKWAKEVASGSASQ